MYRARAVGGADHRALVAPPVTIGPMTTWLVRAGRTGDLENLALEKGIAVLGWEDIPELCGAKTREDVEAIYRQHSPDAGVGRVGNHVGQLWAFSHRIQPGDLVVLPLKRRSSKPSFLSSPCGLSSWRSSATERGRRKRSFFQTESA